ncbi:hypothetical protein MTO96_004079 [Rhipicephalus appendiculatus]
MKVYCWNEAHGCDYKSATEDMLQHYEKECTFHSVECWRCGEAVLHKELKTHFAAACSVRVSSPHSETTSPEPRTLSLQDVSNALEDVKTLLKIPNDDQVRPEIQSQASELMEQVGNQESRLAEDTCEVGSSANAATAESAAPASSAALQESASRRNPADEARTSASLPPCSNEMLMNQEHEIFSNISCNILNRMQKTSTEDFPQHCIDYFDRPYCECRLTLTTPLSTTRTWKVPGTVTYVATLEDCTFLPAVTGKHLCCITVLHTRDASFTVDLTATVDAGLILRIDFSGVVSGARCSVPSFDFTLLNGEREETFRRTHRGQAFICDDAKLSRLHFGSTLQMPPAVLERAGCHSNGKVDLKIRLSQEDNTQDGHPSC